VTEFGDGVDRAERVRDVGEGEELHFRRQQVVEAVEREPTLGVDRHEA
jgi:hypothetical protein